MIVMMLRWLLGDCVTIVVHVCKQYNCSSRQIVYYGPNRYIGHSSLSVFLQNNLIANWKILNYYP